MTASQLRRLLLASTAALAVVLAGCTADEPSQPTENAATSPPPGDDFAENMVGCLTEKGWEVEATWDGGFVVPNGIPEDQVARFVADEEECAAQFGYDQMPPPLTQQEAEDLYDTLLEVADCVRELGYTVPEPPTKQAYVEHLTSGGLAEWHPHYVPEADDMTVYQEVRLECPAP